MYISNYYYKNSFHAIIILYLILVYGNHFYLIVEYKGSNFMYAFWMNILY